MSLKIRGTAGGSVTIVDEPTATDPATTVETLNLREVMKGDSNAFITSIDAGDETRIPEIVMISQLSFDAMGPGRPNKLYIIVG